MKTVQQVLTLGSAMAAIAVVCMPTSAAASEARFEIRAYVPERCGGSTIAVDPMSGGATGLSCNFTTALKIQTTDVAMEVVNPAPARPSIAFIASATPDVFNGWQDSFFSPEQDVVFEAQAIPSAPSMVRVVNVSI